MSPCGPDHADVELGDLRGDQVDRGLMLMPSTTKTSLWRVHPPSKAGVLGFVPDPAELYRSCTYAHGPRGAVLSDADSFGQGGTPKTDALLDKPPAQSAELWSNAVITRSLCDLIGHNRQLKDHRLGSDNKDMCF